MNSEVVIRPVERRDAAGINALRRMPGVFENIMGIPSERIARTESGIENLSDNLHEFVALLPDENGGELVAGCGVLSVSTRHRMRHVGGIGMMVHRDYQGSGIGTKLMEALLDIADNWLMLVRVELEVFTDNKRAIGLYHKFGFEIEGTKRMAAIRNGIYEDNYIMARLRDL